MNKIVEQIREAWKEAAKQIHENPEAFRKHYPALAPAQVDEAMETFCKWAERQAVPHGFKPVGALARTLLTTEASKLLASIQEFVDSPDWAFPFMEPLARGISFVSLAAVFSDKEEGRRLVAEQGGKLAESLALMDTAQVELGAKMEAMKVADEIIEKLRKHEEGITANKQKAEEQCASILATKAQTDEAISVIKEAQVAAQTLKESVQNALVQAQKLQEQNQTFQSTLATQAEQMEALKTKAAEQSKLISDLLPGATGAGLAAAYGDRARSLVSTMKLWRWIFIISISLLVIGSATLVGLTVNQDTDIWRYFFLRLPVVVPVVWIAWFSAIQYGNAMRLEENYSFKEATSKAFAGYREHIAHLGGVGADAENPDSSGQEVVKQLAASTVSILGKPPSDAFGRSEKEASPLSQILAIMAGKIFGGKTGKSD